LSRKYDPDKAPPFRNLDRSLVGTYGYENTTPERFQEFCQALLMAEYQGLQCFPVGQPDGGRDAWHPDTRTVLQVKFRRNDEPESAAWMIETLEHELPKIKRLISLGATKYIMVTNARGTAHPDAGRIDLVQQWLTNNVSIPAQCLWRNDLDRRFDGAQSSLKFKYPEFLTGQDTIEYAIQMALGPNRERQMRTLKSFVATQFDADAKVKFKQVNLSNSLADLFVDIPIRVSHSLLARIISTDNTLNTDFLQSNFALRDIHLALDHDSAAMNEIVRRGARVTTRFGAAQFLLGPIVQKLLPKVVLEGAPGQGKSTLAQYVCQVHRATLLDNKGFLASIPLDYRQSEFRMPIKIDIRDLATHVASLGESASLDAFISELVHHESGQQTFTVDDFNDILSRMPILLFMDGLDEVADLDLRRAVVALVRKALARYDALGANLQVVVTSRPSIFGNKANLNDSGFATIDLANIDRGLAFDYSHKWAKARGLEPDEAASVLSILRDKMELPHIVELTRNPMQLAILLSLIHQVGYSLPDQRTDLYRRYLELFLIREAEKTPSVKKHSAVLISFIQYLAWQLQSQAESAGSNGSISETQLQELARDYLRAANYPVELADDLFGGGIERIFVLVQRVSGLYEFEVQPLREFFCARHLYETSPVGTYRYQKPRGDRAQRFEALARNPFWLNVTRFYAGSYEPGEIGSLVLSLKDLIADSDPAVAIHARRVAFALISDWVFANKRAWQNELIRAACDQVGIELLVSDRNNDGDGLVLDEDCGQDVLRGLVFDTLSRGGSRGREFALCSILSANGGRQLKEEFEGLVCASTGPERTSLLRQMVSSGAADQMKFSSLLALMEEDKPTKIELGCRLTLLTERRAIPIESDPGLVNRIVDHGLNGGFVHGTTSFEPVSVFVDLMSALPNGVYAVARFARDTETGELLRGRFAHYGPPANMIPEFLERTSIAESRDMRVGDVDSVRLANAIQGIFGGDLWPARVAALRAAGMSMDRPSLDAARLFDTRVPLSERARYARLKRGSVGWWQEQLSAVSDDVEGQLFWALMVIVWTSPPVFEALRTDAESLVANVTDERLEELAFAIRGVNSAVPPRRDRAGYVPNLATSGGRFAWLVALGFRLEYKAVLAHAAGSDCAPLERWVRREKGAQELARGMKPDLRGGRLATWLEKVVIAQAAGITLSGPIRNVSREVELDERVAKRVLANPARFPVQIVMRVWEWILASYTPETLTNACRREDWSFE